MRLWLLTRRITHLPEKGDRICGEALHLAPQSCGFRLLRFTLQLPTPNVPHMHLLAQPIQASTSSDFFHFRNWGHPTAAGQSTVALVYVGKTLHQTILRIRVRILTWRCTLRSLKAELHQQALRPSFLTFSAVSFFRCFSLLLHFCFLNLLCFLPLVFPHLYFCFVATFFFLIVFLYTSWISFCWAFSFSCLFSLFLLCISLFSLLEIISLFRRGVCLFHACFCRCHFPYVSISPQNISFLLLSFFFFPFFYSAYFLVKKKWEMAWCNGCPADEISDNWSYTDFTRSTTSPHAAVIKRATQRNLPRIWKKWFSWELKICFFIFFSKKRTIQMSERKTVFPIVSEKNAFKQDIPFQKEWTIKTRE